MAVSVLKVLNTCLIASFIGLRTTALKVLVTRQKCADPTSPNGTHRVAAERKARDSARAGGDSLASRTGSPLRPGIGYGKNWLAVGPPGYLRSEDQGKSM
jgi:hypothetical protein